jgi:DNA-3-methyladenine glycosylase II
LRALPLTKKSLALGLEYLSQRDADLARIYNALGTPPLWSRTAGFPTLIHIILEQQVSLASAKAAHARLLAVASPLTPQKFLELDDALLKTIGFSRQKISYGRYLAQSILEGALDLGALKSMDDARAKSELVKLKGIGAWTADIYLLMALRRPDIWPVGDLAIAIAVQQVKRLHARPTSDELIEIGEQWKPWRAVAARLLWNFYLNKSRIQI